ncbi:GNAT family N-acetyltransferase [Neisseriaceae bacterium JH1-16]|nr:GNAT family N-acetyltransferase [Neisseriaceae bacterium JH1-16]
MPPPEPPPQLTLLSDRPERLDELTGALHAEWSAFAPWASKERVRDRLQGQLSERVPFTWLLLSASDALLGSASVKCHELAGHPDKPYWLGEVWVAPEYRGEGLGRQLVTACIDHAARLGLPALHLYTPDQQDWYRRLGWRDVEEVQQDGEAVTIMRRDLHAA